MLAVARPTVQPAAGPPSPWQQQQQQLAAFAPAPGYPQQPAQYAYPQYPQAAPPQLQQYQQPYAPALAQPPAAVGRSELQQDVECAKAGVFCGKSTGAHARSAGSDAQ